MTIVNVPQDVRTWAKNIRILIGNVSREEAIASGDTVRIARYELLDAYEKGSK